MSKSLLALGIIVAGVVTAVAAAAPGKLDPGFGSGGVVVTATAPAAGTDFQNGLAIQRDRRIVVGGESDLGAGAGGFQWRVARYLRNGALDASFGTGGMVTTSMSSAGGEDEHLWELALQADGKIVAAGEAVSATGGFDVALARFDADGSLDAGFGTGGKVTTAIGPGTRRDNAFQVAIARSGEIVVAGFADMGAGGGGRNFMLARYHPNGTLDSSFGSGGVVITRVAPGDNRDQIENNGIAFDDEGRLVVAGAANMGAGAGGTDFALARYNADGTLDTSFAGDGTVTTAIGPGDGFDYAVGVAIDEKGRIMAAGGAETGGFIFDLALARYKADGSLDPSFGTSGKVMTNVGPGNTDDEIEEIAIQETGRILVGGSAAATALGIDSDFVVARYTRKGALDGSFGSGGIVVTPTAPEGADDETFNIALQSDAKLVASGECEQPATGRDVCLARYKVGEPD